MIGLALKRDAGEPLAAFRVWLLIQGTQDTDIDIIDDTKKLQEQTFKMISNNTRCLLSNTPTTVQLVAYCDFKKSLTYRLDRELAPLLVSAVERHRPGSASLSAEAPEGNHITATVEHMEKISKDEKKALESAMTLEWKSVLTIFGEDAASPKRLSSTELEYWTSPRVSKLRRMESEPQ